MMDVQFATFSKRENSTAQPTSFSATLSCQLKEPCDVRTPVLIIRAWDMSYNYAYISAWNRYYFISDVTFLTGERVEVALTCDVLATYKATIQSYTAFVERCASSSYYDVNVIDAYLSNKETLATNSTATTEFSGGFSYTGFYVLRTIGTDGITTYLLSLSDVNSVLDFMFTDSNFTDVLTDVTVKTFFNPFQYVVDLKWIPYNLSTLKTVVPTLSQSTKSVKFGWWDSGVNGLVVSQAYEGVNWGASITLPTNAYSDFRRYDDRFSQYSLYLPALGSVPVQAKDTVAGLYVQYTLDIISGMCYIALHAGSSSGAPKIATYSTQLAVPIQLGQMESPVSGIVTGVTSTVTSALFGNVGGAVANGFNTVTSALSPTPSINGTSGGKYVLRTHRDITCRLVNLASCEFPTTYAGRPCYKVVQLSNLSGYVQCAGASVSTIAYDADKTAVNSFLNGGFYLE